MVATGRRWWGFFVVAVAMAFLAAACSSSSSDAVDDSDQEPAMESAEVDGDETADSNDSSEAAGPEVAEPLFTAQYWSELGLSGIGSQIADVVGLDGDEFLVVSVEVDPEARTRAVHIVHIGGPTGEGTRSEATLPTGGSTDVTVAAATEHDGEVVVAGTRRQAGIATPVVWVGSQDDADYSLVDLPSSAERTFISQVADDGTAASGVVINDGAESAVVWLREGDNWDIVTLPTPEGAPESYASDVMATDDGHLVSGWGFSPVDDRRWPTIWEVTDQGITAHAVDVGIDSLTVTGISDGPTSSILVVGDQVQTASEALVYVADGPAGPWRQIELSVDTGGRFSNRGFGLVGVERRGDRLVTWTDNGFTRVVFGSNDGGASWTQRGFLGDMGEGGVTVAGVGVSDSSIMAGGYHDLFRWGGSAWVPIRSGDLATHDGAFTETSVAHDDDGFVVAGEFRDPANGALSPGSLRLYRLADDEWVGENVAEPRLKKPSQFVRSGDELALVGMGLTFNDDPVPVWTAGNDRWSIIEYDQIDGLRSIPVRSVGDGQGGILTITNEVETSEIVLTPRLFSGRTEITGSVDASGDSDELQRVRCLLQAWDGYVTVFEYSTQTLVLTAGRDLAFTELEPAAEAVAGSNVIACVVRGDELLMATLADGDRMEVVSIDADGAVVSRELLPDGFSISGFLQSGDITLAFGSSDASRPETGAVVWEGDDGWEVLTGPDSGLAPDDFGRWTLVTGLHLLPDELVLTGRDTNGRVFWTADRASFFDRIGIADNGAAASSTPDLS